MLAAWPLLMPIRQVHNDKPDYFKALDLVLMESSKTNVS